MSSKDQNHKTKIKSSQPSTNTPKNVIKIMCTKENRFRKILKSFSAIMSMSLSDKEVDIICLLYERGGAVTTEGRKEIREKLNMSTEYMNNYVRRLRKKHIIVNDRLNATLMSIDVTDESKPYLLLFEFPANYKGPANGGGTE